MNARTWLATALRLALAAVWLYAGASKISDADASGRAVRAYQILPDGMARAVGYGLPFVEITIGLLLLAGVGVRVLARVSALLLAVFRYGREVGRDLLFVAMAGFLLYWPRTRLAVDNLLFREISE